MPSCLLASVAVTYPCHQSLASSSKHSGMGMQSGQKRPPTPAPPRCPPPDADGKQPFYNIYHTVQREKRGQVVYNLAALFSLFQYYISAGFFNSLAPISKNFKRAASHFSTARLYTT